MQEIQENKELKISLWKKFKTHISGFNIVSIILGAIALAVTFITKANPQAADFLADTISFAVRFTLSRITYFIPFSLVEFILYFLLLMIAVLIINIIITLIFVKNIEDDGSIQQSPPLIKSILTFVSSICVFYFITVFSLGVLYNKTPVENHVGIEKKDLSADDLNTAYLRLVSEVNAIDLAKYKISGFENTFMPYNLNEMSARLNKSYDKLAGDYDFFNNIPVRVKPVLMSEMMSRIHITGMYSFFTGEANINIDFPDYTIPFTAAHEMAHLRGMIKENEANFTAFLVCYNSDDEYIRYSGILSMIEYIGSALYKADSELYFESLNLLNQNVTGELIAFSEFFAKYKDSSASKVSNKVNDTFLKINGQKEGIQSYGMVVDLAVAYLNR